MPYVDRRGMAPDQSFLRQEASGRASRERQSYMYQNEYLPEARPEFNTIDYKPDYRQHDYPKDDMAIQGNYNGDQF